MTEKEEPMSQVAMAESREVARPLNVLVPLIKEDLKHGNEAGMPFYEAAGKKLIEAKTQLKHGEFKPWIKRNFEFSYSSAVQYMGYASREEKFRALNFSSLNDYHRQTGSSQYRDVTTKRPWHQPVREAIDKVDTEALNRRRDEMNREQERDAQRKLALQLIDIGYKALASKLHPDKGGSRDAMARLNAVRDRLKGSV